MTYSLQQAMSAFKAVLGDDLSPEEQQKRAYLFRRALIAPAAPMSEHEDCGETLDEVVRVFLEAGRVPGVNVSWRQFYRDVRSALGTKAWARGHSPRSIRRAVDRAKSEFGQNGQKSRDSLST